MARIRTIKPEFFRHEELYQAEIESGLPLRVAFAGLWTACDREGRFKWAPKSLKLDCLPYDDVDFSRVLDALATRGFIVKYASENNLYGYVPGFARHQVINNREAPSKLPKPLESNILLTRDPRVIDACPTPLVHAQAEGKGREGKGKEDSEATPLRTSRADSPLDLKKELFDRGTAFLKSNGSSDRAARSVLAMWRKSHGDVAVINALAAAEGVAASDPVAYITNILKDQPRGKTDSTLASVSSLMQLASDGPDDELF
jgi:hypothetical protein